MIDHNTLIGTLPTELGALTELAMLDMCTPALLSVSLNFLFRRLTCHLILQISDYNSLTGTIPTEIGMMTSLRVLYMGTLSLFAFRLSIPIIFKLVGCAFSVPTPYFSLYSSTFSSNSLTGMIPTEIGMMTSFTLLALSRILSIAFHGLCPCWVFLERIRNIFKLVDCDHNVSVLSPYTCHFILQISASNSLTGMIPTEIGMMTSLVQLYVCTCP
jgi:hypothetical protein